MSKTLYIALICSFFAISCKKERILSDSGVKLEFSKDTVLFDTVFTTLGSATRQFKIYNRNNGTLKINSIALQGGASSKFRINVDGTPLTTTGEVLIPANDSLYVFVDVTIDPNGQNSPLVVSDRIVFNTNGNQQDVILEAWGQDAYYHSPDIFPTNGFPPYSIFDCAETWTSDKPHVIYGYAVVDSSCALTMMPGTRVHLHHNAVLWVYKGGKLVISGSKDDRVIIQGDRLETEFADIPGQWGKIWLSALSKGNTIDWAIIKNGSIGLQVDSFPSGSEPALQISNTEVYNMSSACIYGQGGRIWANNCVFGNAGQYSAALTIGGKYSFKHCTFGNYDNSNRQTSAVLLNNWYKDIYRVNHSRNLDSAYFGNCIIYGNITEELGLDSALGGKFDYYFDHCLIKTGLSTSNPYHYSNCLANNNPDFVDASEQDFRIAGASAAINKGKIAIGAQYPLDLKGDSRTSDVAPDIGAFEK